MTNGYCITEKRMWAIIWDGGSYAQMAGILVGAMETNDSVVMIRLPFGELDLTLGCSLTFWKMCCPGKKSCLLITTHPSMEKKSAMDICVMEKKSCMAAILPRRLFWLQALGTQTLSWRNRDGTLQSERDCRRVRQTLGISTNSELLVLLQMLFPC